MGAVQHAYSVGRAGAGCECSITRGPGCVGIVAGSDLTCGATQKTRLLSTVASSQFGQEETFPTATDQLSGWVLRLGRLTGIPTHEAPFDTELVSGGIAHAHRAAVSSVLGCGQIGLR